MPSLMLMPFVPDLDGYYTVRQTLVQFVSDVGDIRADVYLFGMFRPVSFIMTAEIKVI